MKFDEILTNYLGDFGAYQRKVYLLVCLPAIWCSMNMFCWTFTGAEIPHRCKLDSDDVDYHTPRNTTYQLNHTETDAYNKKCTRIHIETGRSEGCLDGFVFDNSEIAASAVQDWLLVCDDRWIVASVQSLFYVGIFFGSLTLGFLADKVGRKMVILVGSFLITVLSIACVLSPNIFVFSLFRFAHGFLEPALWQVPFVIALELVGPSKRVVAGMVIEFFFTAGIVLLGCIAYFIRDWRTLQVVVSAPGFLFLSYYWLIPESPRWLLAAGRREEALRVLRTCAKYNKVTLPEEVLETMQEEESTAAADEGQNKTRTYGYYDLIRTPNMRRKTFVCCYCWTIVTLIYYGISLNPSAIAGDFYVSFILTGFVEVPALILLLLLLNHLGRKFLQSGGFMLSGLAFFIIVLVPTELKPITFILVLISKSAVTAAFCVIYLHTSEIFPTVVRGIALGLTVTCSRMGGIMSPIASMFLTEEYQGVVLTAFGAFGVLAALVTLTLPETTHQKLPETLEDGENFGKEMSLSCGAKKRNMDAGKDPEEDLKMVKA